MGKTTHGMGGRKTRHPLYPIWQSMKQRCLSPTHPAYYRYGGRGISVCDRWRDDFPAFLADMGPRPDGGTLERIDNERGYEPDNCRWASRREQAQNRAPHFSRLNPAAAEDARQRFVESCRANAARRRNPPKVCLHCGGEYRRQGHTKRPPKYCSHHCYIAHCTRNWERPCAFCGTSFIPKRRKAVARYCSLGCSARHREARRRAA